MPDVLLTSDVTIVHYPNRSDGLLYVAHFDCSRWTYLVHCVRWPSHTNSQALSYTESGGGEDSAGGVYIQVHD